MAKTKFYYLDFIVHQLFLNSHMLFTFFEKLEGTTNYSKMFNSSQYPPDGEGSVFIPTQITAGAKV